jgi:aminoacrylate peracid reductase
MTKQCINPPELMTPHVPFSWATRTGNLIFLAGHAALDKDGKVVGEGDIRRQTEHTLQSIKTSVEAAGGTLRDIVKATVFLTDMANYAGFNEVYRRYFPSEPPARATLLTGLVIAGLLIEIEAIAVIE